MSKTNGRLITVRQTAEVLGTSEKWVRRRVHDGTLPFAYMKVGKLLRFDERDVAAYLESVRHEAVSA